MFYFLAPNFFLEIVFLDLKYFSKTGSLNAPKYRKIDPPYLRTCIKYYFFKSISIPQCGLLPYLGFLLGAVWAPLLRAAAAGHLLLTNQLYQDAQPCRAGTHWAPAGWGTSWPPGSSCCGCRCCCWSWGWCCQSCCPGSACLAAWWQLPPPRPRGLLLARWRHHHRACAAASAWAAASCSYPAHAPAVAWKIAILHNAHITKDWIFSRLRLHWKNANFGWLANTAYYYMSYDIKVVKIYGLWQRLQCCCCSQN